MRVMHESQGQRPLGLYRRTTQGHTKGEPLYRRKGKMVMVQEDQAGEPWSSDVGLYTVDEGFKAPP